MKNTRCASLSRRHPEGIEGTGNLEVIHKMREEVFGKLFSGNHGRVFHKDGGPGSHVSLPHGKIAGSIFVFKQGKDSPGQSYTSQNHGAYFQVLVGSDAGRNETGMSKYRNVTHRYGNGGNHKRRTGYKNFGKVNL